MKEKQKLAVAKTTEELAEEQEETYLNYTINIETMNITVEDGGKVVFQKGKPKDPPPY